MFLSKNLLMIKKSGHDLSLINGRVLPFEAQAIQAIHIERQNKPDSKYWRYEKNGIYSVKSGYRIDFNENKDQGGYDTRPSCSYKDPF